MQLCGRKSSGKRKQEVQGSSTSKSTLGVFEEYMKTSVLEQIDGKSDYVVLGIK